MPQELGNLARILIDTETTFQTDPVSPDGKVLPFLTEGINTPQNLIDDETIKGDRHEPMPVLGNIDVSGSINCNLGETAHADILKHCFGVLSTTGASDPYTHTLKIGNLPVGLLLEKQFPSVGKYYKYNGCKVARVTFNWNHEGILNASIDVMGSKLTIDTSSYDATPTERAYNPFSMFLATIKVGGSTIAYIQSLQIVLDNQLEGDTYVIGGQGIRRWLNTSVAKVSGSLTALFESNDLIDTATAGTETSIEIILDRNTTPARKLTLKCPEVLLQKVAPAVDTKNGLKITMPFRAYKDDSAEASALVATLVNGLATF